MIKYRKLSRKERNATNGRYKYELTKTFRIFVKVKPKQLLVIPGYIELHTDGLLVIYKGYRWDGPSFLTFDWPAHVMEDSLVHDSLYQLMREELLDIKYRPQADEILRDMMIANARPKKPPKKLLGKLYWGIVHKAVVIRANLWCWCVKKFAGKYAEPKELI